MLHSDICWSSVISASVAIVQAFLYFEKVAGYRHAGFAGILLSDMEIATALHPSLTHLDFKESHVTILLTDMVSHHGLCWVRFGIL